MDDGAASPEGSPLPAVPARWRFALGGRWGMFVVMMCLLWLIPVRAAFADASTSVCDQPVDPYTLSDPQLQSCGFEKVPAVSHPLAGGGTVNTYTVGGHTFSLTAAPRSFDAATATPAQRAEYGIPAEPPVTSVSQLLSWQEMISNIHAIPPMPYLIIEPNLRMGESYGSSEGWSGYMDWNGNGGYTQATGYYWEPKTGTTHCSNSAVSMWAGIGGWYNSYLGQDGTAIEAPGLADNQAWIEVLPAGAAPIQLYATPGYAFEAQTSYTGGGQYSFYLYNFYTHAYARGSGTGGFDGNVAEFVTERPSDNNAPLNLLNFQSVTMQGFTNNNALTDYPYENLTMNEDYTPNNDDNELAYAGGMYNAYQFDDYHSNCG